MSNWSREKTLQLIEKIRASNVWDVKSKEYKDLKKRKDIFTVIGEQLNFSAKDVETEWHTIKSQYSRELVKVMASRKSGAGTEEIYTPSWYAYHGMSYFFVRHPPLPYEQNRSTDETATEEFNESYTDETMLDINEEHESDQDCVNEIPAPTNGSTSFNLQPYKTAIKKPKLQNNDMQAMVKQMTVVGEKLANKQTVRDEFNIFGEYVASELRKCNGSKYAFILADVKYKITSALHEAEMERIRMDNSSTYSASSNPETSSNDPKGTHTYIILDTTNTSDANAAQLISEFNENV